jgi:hypothetical protein
VLTGPVALRDALNASWLAQADAGTRSDVTWTRRTSRFGRLASAPVGILVGAPIAAVEVVGSTWNATRAGLTAVTAAAESLPRLARQAARILDAVEPPALHVANSLDVDGIDRLMLSLQVVPDLVTALLGWVARFESFVTAAEATRSTADLTVQHVAEAVRDVQLLIGQTAESINRAAEVIAGGDSLLNDVGVLTERVSSVVTVADVTAGLAQEVARTVSGLIDTARPVVELSADLSRQAEEPLRVLFKTADAVAPKAAAITPEVLAALSELSNRLPELLRRIDLEVLPTVEGLQRTPHDVRALRESVEEIQPKLSEVEAELAGLPGAKVLRRRGRRPDPAATVEPPTERPSSDSV